ncbi:hypothetical protein C5167_016495 [Papaver somniferum]|nr:hypothetical protein C5167_016495 [Papaver somniferum]
MHDRNTSNPGFELLVISIANLVVLDCNLLPQQLKFESLLIREKLNVVPFESEENLLLNCRCALMSSSFMSGLACKFNDETEDDVMGLELGEETSVVYPYYWHNAISVQLRSWVFCCWFTILLMVSNVKSSVATSPLLKLSFAVSAAASAAELFTTPVSFYSSSSLHQFYILLYYLLLILPQLHIFYSLHQPLLLPARFLFATSPTTTTIAIR